MSRLSIAVLGCVVALALASCDREAAPATAPVAKPAQPAPFVAPQDVFERDARAIVGISYPPGLERYPALAKLLVAHAQARRAVLDGALAKAPSNAAPFELTLRFSTAADAPRMFAVVADEELYTGGATSRPSRTVFLWLPAQNRLLTPDEMIPDPAAWSRLHADIRKLQRQESASLSAPDAEGAMQRVFVPRFNSAGRIAGLRFPTDGGGEVEVAGSDLKSLVAPAYAAWFEDAPMSADAAPAPSAPATP
ncbi:hypothetical protein [Lysobacter arvi]|uniref:DUF3298 domain-containing protein n=1 Tax=Lysobacter arvi TaxID=3038776 RepID=A0ABU1C8Q9_9GAMM|nr:hypothetical protein [Lysobacter arvi]MDR0181557.1 hypothetical protein [Lysobacter arvi]